MRKLIKGCVSVVIADQFVIPNSNRFDRSVSRIVTPGIIPEESLLDRNRNNFLLFLDPLKMIRSWMDISTGDFFITAASGESEFTSLLARLKPREVPNSKC